MTNKHKVVRSKDYTHSKSWSVITITKNGKKVYTHGARRTWRRDLMYAGLTYDQIRYIERRKEGWK